MPDPVQLPSFSSVPTQGPFDPERGSVMDTRPWYQRIIDAAKKSAGDVQQTVWPSEPTGSAFTALRKASSIGQDTTVQGAMPFTPGGTFLRLGKALPAIGEAIAAPTSRLASVLQPAEAGQYRLASDIVDRFGKLHKVGAQSPADWAGLTHEVLDAFSGDREKAARWARLIGATSPNTSVPVNTRESLVMLAHMLEGKPPLASAKEARDLGLTMTVSKYGNINRAMEGRPLSGDKVEAFGQLMTGQVPEGGRARLPLDRHALWAGGTTKEKFAEELTPLREMMSRAEGRQFRPVEGGNTEIYQRVERAMSDALKEVAPNQPEPQRFPQMWEGVRIAKGLKYQGGPVDILRAKGLLQRGAMLDPERLRKALQDGNWSAAAIAAVMGAMSQYAPKPKEQ